MDPVSEQEIAQPDAYWRAARHVPEEPQHYLLLVVALERGLANLIPADIESMSVAAANKSFIHDFGESFVLGVLPLPATVIASTLGMNMGPKYMLHSWVFWAGVALMLVIGVVVLVTTRLLRHWL